MVQKVLITRPLVDANVLAKELDALGFETLIEPMLSIENINADLHDLQQYDGFIFTSANGVRSFSSLSDMRDKTVFTVGEKTAFEAIQSGFTIVQSTGSDVEALTAFLKTQKGLYAHFRGKDVAQSFSNLLGCAADISINEFIIYRAVKTTQISTNILNNMDNNDVSYVLFYSKRTAEIFVELLQCYECTSFVQGIKALCLADSMVECLSVLPWEEIRVAEHPNQRSMLELLK